MKSHAIRVAGAAALLLATASLGGAASGITHLELVKAEPAQDATVTTSPTMIRLYYSQTPDMKGTQVRLTNAASAPVALGAVTPDEQDDAIVNAPVTGTLAPGVYTVTWRALSDDGHIVNGKYNFTFRAAN